MQFTQGDARAPSSNLAWDASADIEALAWDPHTPTRFLASAEDGIVAAFDARNGGGAAPLFRLQAHDAPACCICFNPAARDLLATASTDKKVHSARTRICHLCQAIVIVAPDREGFMAQPSSASFFCTSLRERARHAVSAIPRI